MEHEPVTTTELHVQYDTISRSKNDRLKIELRTRRSKDERLEKGSLPNTPEDDISKGDEPFDPRSKGQAF